MTSSETTRLLTAQQLHSPVIREYVPGRYPGRDALTESPFRSARDHTLNPAYRVGIRDGVELFLSVAPPIDHTETATPARLRLFSAPFASVLAASPFDVPVDHPAGGWRVQIPTAGLALGTANWLQVKGRVGAATVAATGATVAGDWKLDAQVIPYKIPEGTHRRSPDVPAPITPADSYVLKDVDRLVFSLARAVPPIPVQLRLPTLNVQMAWPSAIIPVSVLIQADELMVLEKNGNTSDAAVVRLSRSLDGLPKFRPGVTTWERLRKILTFQEDRADPDNSFGGPLRYGDFFVNAVLRPEVVERAGPGEPLVLTRLTRQGKPRAGDGGGSTDPELPFAAEEFRATVDPLGFLWVPPLRTAVDRDDTAGAYGRLVYSQVEAKTFRVRAWFPDRPYEEQPVLADVAAALAAAPGPGELGPNTPDAATLGIDGRFNFEPLHRHVRYALRRERCTWTLIDEDSGRYEVPFLCGQRVIEGVAEAYPRLRGSALFGHDAGPQEVEIRVIPDSLSLVPGREGFTARVRPSARSRLEDVLLHPGDTVRVTRVAPRGD